MSIEAVLNALGNDGRMISYRPEWRPMVGSVNAVILLQQLLYWWKQSGSQPFYKFRAPCKHEKYRAGDSWCEELGFSKFEFDKAWKQIEEAGFASKKTNLERVTFYSVDEAVLGKSIMLIYGENQQDSDAKPRKSTNLIYENKESEPSKSTNSTPVNQESEFTLYKEHRLPTEITTETTQPTQTLPSRKEEPATLQQEEQKGGVGADLKSEKQQKEINAGAEPLKAPQIDLVWPTCMTKAEQVEAVRLLQRVDLNYWQWVLDAWAWKINNEAVISRMGILGHLCKEASNGSMDEVPAMRWRDKEERQEKASVEYQKSLVRKDAEQRRLLDAELHGAVKIGEMSQWPDWAKSQLKTLQRQWLELTGQSWEGLHVEAR